MVSEAWEDDQERYENKHKNVYYFPK